MSERGIFSTGFIYDTSVLPALTKHLPSICRTHTDFRIDGGRVVSGRMHGTWPTEEAFEMEMFISDVLLPALPAEHGRFSIVVVPDDDDATVLFVIQDRIATKRVLAAPQEMSR